MIVDFLLLLASLVLFLGSVTPYLKMPGRQETDLPSHFVLQYFIAGCLLALLTGVFHPPMGAHMLILASLVLNLVQMMPYIRFGRADIQSETGKPLRILQVNVLKLNSDASRLKALIEKEAPDIIVAAEVRGPFAQMFNELKYTYPYLMLEPREKSSYGMAVASKIPLHSYEKKTLDGADNLAMAFRVMHDGREVEFLSMHPATPNRDIASRDREFDNAVKHFGARRGNIVVLGDLNATPYCFALKKLCRALNLRNAREGHGIHGTFPVFLPTWALKLPIDHVLVAENLHIDSFRAGPDIGSDHLPTLTTLSHIND